METSDKKYILVTGESAIQGSEAWKEFRRDKIGASDVPTILGNNPWETPLEFWKRRMMSVDIPETIAMKRGKELEGPAREILNQQTGKNFQPCVIQSIRKPWLIASLDGMHVDEDGTISICEIKCPGKSTHELAKIGQVPYYYIPQLCHQCMIAGVTECLYASWDGKSGQIETVLYKAEQSMCDAIESEVSKFLTNYENFIPPYSFD